MTRSTILRPATNRDADAVWGLLAGAAASTVGMGLPATAQAAKELCEITDETVADLAAGSFAVDDGGRRRLLFVAVDPDDDALLGVTGCTFKNKHPNLAVYVETSTDGLGLTMHSVSSDWTRTELDSSFLGPDARGHGYGTLLSRGRLTFLHLVAGQIPTTIASHLRGRFDDAGSAPFWPCFGAHFAPQWASSREAELAIRQDPRRIAEFSDRVLPLTAPVLDCLGPVNAASLPAFRVLMREGLNPNGMFDPIDGGPTLVAELSSTATHRLRRHGRAVIGERGGADSLIAVASVPRFRVTRGRADTTEPGVVTIDPTTARALGVETGSLIAVSPLG